MQKIKPSVRTVHVAVTLSISKVLGEVSVTEWRGGEEEKESKGCYCVTGK